MRRMLSFECRMWLHKISRLFVVAFTALLFALSASAQEPPATPPSEQKAEQETPYPKPFRGIYIEEGWTSWGLGGNEHRFRQFATPPQWLHTRRFIFDSGFGLPPVGGHVDLKTIGEPDHFGEGLLLLGHGSTILKGFERRSVFFDPTPVVIRDSDRTMRDASLRQKLGRDASITAGYRHNEQNQFYQPPKDDLRQWSRIWDVQLAGRIGHGYGGVAFAANRYFDRMGARPELDGVRWNAHYGQPIGDRLNVEGAFSRSNIDQVGLPSSDVTSWRVDADYDLSDDTRIEASHRRLKLDLPTVQNAYVRERFESRIEIDHKFKGWSGQLGLRQNEVERVRGDHTFADVLRWNGIHGRATGRIKPWLRATLSGSLELLDGDAPMITNDPRALFWDDKRKLDVKLDASSDKYQAYLSWGYRFYGNEERGVEIRSQGTVLGASYQVSPQTEVFAEYAGDFYDAQGQTGSPTLDEFFAGSASYVLGVNWVFSELTSASVNYTQFLTNNSNPLGLPEANLRLNSWYASVRHRTPSGMDFSVTLSLWLFTDKMFGAADSHATIWTITIGGRYSTK